MTTARPLERGPYLSAALICEKILVEQDGIKSAIRIIDRLTRTAVGPHPPDEMEPFDYDMTLLIRLKSGSVRGVYSVRIQLVKPSGESPTPFSQSVLFEGEEDRGIDIVVQLRVKFDQTGIYWFRVYFADTELTRLPLRVIYMPQVRQIHDAGGHPPPAQEPPTGA